MPLPLSALFIDCDSYFASVEQHLNPHMRGKPVGVAPVLAETSCCIAASYEAKAFGIKTGTPIHQARKRCPDIHIVEARPRKYIEYHHQIVAAVERCIHVEEVLSIDEMWAWLPYNWREPQFIQTLGDKIKRQIAQDVSPVINVSIGAAPNRFLAKIASKMRKPNGFFIIQSQQLPEILYELKLDDLHGIAHGMETRLHAAGIHSTEQLCQASKQQLRSAWNGVLGERYWHHLRGIEVQDPPTQRRTMGHSHVLPPAKRAPADAWPILCKLLHKACERLRADGLLCSRLDIQLRIIDGPSYKEQLSFPPTDTTLHLMRLLKKLWKNRPFPEQPILKVGLVLSGFSPIQQFIPDLFTATNNNAQTAEQENRLRRLDQAVDKLRERYGRQSINFGNIQSAREQAPMRISFGHIPDLHIEDDHHRSAN